MFSNFYPLFTLTNLSVYHLHYTNLSALAGAQTSQRQNTPAPKQLGAKSRRQIVVAKTAAPKSTRPAGNTDTDALPTHFMI